MGADQSRSRDLVLQSAAGNVDAVRQLLAVYLNQQRHRALITQLPLNQRVDINYQLPEGDFALELATTHGHVAVVELLLEHGCNADAQDADGLTALMCAAHDSGTAIAVQLLRLGRANPDVQDNSGNTALHYAAQLGHAAQVALLLSHGASASIRNNAGVTALGAAAQNAQWAAVRAILTTLRARPAAVSTVATGDQTLDADAALVALVRDAGALRPAAEAAEWDTAQLLLECGADPQERLPSGGRVVDLLPSFLLSALSTISANRRADRAVHALYPFLTGSLVETVLEYDDECYEAPGRCVALARLLHHIRALGAEQDRMEAEQRRRGMAASLTSHSSQSLSSLAVSPSPSPAAPSLRSSSARELSGTGGRIAPPSHNLDTASPEVSPMPAVYEHSQTLQSPPSQFVLPVSLRSAIDQSQADVQMRPMGATGATSAPQRTAADGGSSAPLLKLLPLHSDAGVSAAAASAAHPSSTLASRLRVPLGAPQAPRPPVRTSSLSTSGVGVSLVEDGVLLTHSRDDRHGDSDSDSGSEERSSSPLHAPAAKSASQPTPHDATVAAAAVNPIRLQSNV